MKDYLSEAAPLFDWKAAHADKKKKKAPADEKNKDDSDDANMDDSESDESDDDESGTDGATSKKKEGTKKVSDEKKEKDGKADASGASGESANSPNIMINPSTDTDVNGNSSSAADSMRPNSDGGRSDPTPKAPAFKKMK